MVISKDKLVNAAAKCVVDEIKSLLDHIERTKKLDMDRVPGIRERLDNLIKIIGD